MFDPDKVLSLLTSCSAIKIDDDWVGYFAEHSPDEEFAISAFLDDDNKLCSFTKDQLKNCRVEKTDRTSFLIEGYGQDPNEIDTFKITPLFTCFDVLFKF